MTKEEARQNAEVMMAYAEGKDIQYKHKILHKEWHDFYHTEFPVFSFTDSDYRIKPTPEYRPWRPEEVPVGAWIRAATDFARRHGYFSSIIGVSISNIMTVEDSVEDMMMTFEKAFNNYEYSIDKGKTWKPCGVEITS